MGLSYLSHLITDDIGNRFILQSSLRVRHTLQYPAMKIAVQKQNPEFSLLALAITFPFNIWNAYIPFHSPM
jgi:hypothetical protein